MEINEFLYRGVNLNIHNRKEGLKPKGLQFSRVPQHGESYARHGNNLSHGSSTVNAILAHQTCSSKFPSSGISTTPHFEIAKKYSTFESKKGVVYKIDKRKLKENDIESFIVKDWISFTNHPEDDEVILRHKLDKEISIEIIVDIIEVEV